jgi:hypothetical protein
VSLKRKILSVIIIMAENFGPFDCLLGNFEAEALALFELWMPFRMDGGGTRADKR